MNLKIWGLKSFSVFALAVGVNAMAVESSSDDLVAQGRFPQGQTVSIKCESLDHRYNSCFVGYDVDQVVLEQQLSRASCSQGFNWGFDHSRGTVWVDRGCRAVFRVYKRVEPRFVECSSLDFRYSSCYVGPGLHRVELSRQLSRASCILGRTWGFTYDSIWVDRGCRAQFRVY